MVSYFSTLLSFSYYIYTPFPFSFHESILIYFDSYFIQTMNISASESGWTTYLDHLSYSKNPYNRHDYQVKGAYVIEDEEDEDLSMVSDASSGPPHFLENCGADPQFYGFASPAQEERKKSKQKIRAKETRMKQQHQQCLDDTASSPVLHLSQDSAVDQYSTEYFSQAFSTADFEEEATSKKNVAFFKPSMKGKSGSFLGRKRQ